MLALPHIARNRGCEGETFVGFLDMDGRAKWRVTSVLPQAKPWRRRNSFPPSMSNTLGVERPMTSDAGSTPHTARKGMCARETFVGFPLRVRSPARRRPLLHSKSAAPTKRDTRLCVSFCWCERWDLNPHDLTNTGTSSLPVCLFQHARGQNTRLL